MERLAQLRMVFAQTRAADPRLVPLMAVAAAAGLAIPLAVGALTGELALGAVSGVLLALLAGVWMFGRRASAAQMAAIEGQPGAAAAVINAMRGPWRLTPAVAFTRKQDMVHRVIGRPGVILVGEGAPARVASLLEKEERRMVRVVGGVPVHTVVVGDSEGAVPLRRLRTHLMRLGRNLKKGQIDELDTKLSALSGGGPPLPGGPIPRGRPR